MTVAIRELKRRYKTALALGTVAPPYDRALSLPLSTGNPLYDAALTDKLAVTTTLSEAEHLNRAWQLVNRATAAEVATLARHAPLLLNDYKLLLALACWQKSDEEQTRTFLQALPWGWRLRFATAVIKPAAVIFTGWRRTLSFRLVAEPRFPALRELFRELLAQAPGIVLLRYRQALQEAAALLHFRFEGEREAAIHNLCFENGRALVDQPAAVAGLAPIGLYLQARHALQQQDVVTFLDLLTASPQVLPITTYMGLLGNAGLRLTNDHTPAVAALRAYAVRCATPVESLLRLKEWSPWLAPVHVDLLAAKVTAGVMERGLNIPFHRTLTAYIKTPLATRKLVLEPVLLPLLHHFGQQMQELLPIATAPLTYIQPCNVIHLMSFLLYSVVSSALPTRLCLLYDKTVEEVDPPPLVEIAAHLADEPRVLEEWLLTRFGGLAARYQYNYDYAALTAYLQQLDAQTPLLLDLPFARHLPLLGALLPFENVFNFNAVLGAPGELCLNYAYYAQFAMTTPLGSVGVWGRASDEGAQRFSEALERWRAFQQLAAAVDAEQGAGGDA